LFKEILYEYLFGKRPFELPRGLRRRSAAARLLGLWVRIPPGAWVFVYCECCVLSGRGLCDELITLPHESYRMWCVVVCDLETSWMRRPWPSGSCRAERQTDLFRKQLNESYKELEVVFWLSCVYSCYL